MRLNEQTQRIDERIGVGVADWAESGNTDKIPDNKIPTRLYPVAALDLPTEDAQTPIDIKFGQYTADDFAPTGNVVITQSGHPANSVNSGLNGTFTVAVSVIIAAGSSGYDYAVGSNRKTTAVINNGVLTLDESFDDNTPVDSTSTIDAVVADVAELKPVDDSGGGSDYVLPEATTTTIGGVRLATNLDDTGDADVPLATQVKAALGAKADDADISAVGKSNDYGDLDNKPDIPNATPNATTSTRGTVLLATDLDDRADVPNAGQVQDALALITR